MKFKIKEPHWKRCASREWTT